MKYITGALGFVLLIAQAEQTWAATKITSIDFRSEGASSIVEIKSTEPLEAEKQENSNDHQIVLDIKDASLASAAKRPLDTSSFDSNVSLISPYQLDGQNGTVRVVIQLRGNGSADLQQNGNVLKLTIPNSGSSSAETAKEAALAAGIPNPESSVAPIEQATPKKPKTNLEDFFETRVTRKFSGKPITLEFRDGDIVDVLRLIGEASGFNIVVGDDVKGKITLSLVNVPWDQALDLVLHSNGLGAERNNNVLRVATLDNLTKEKNLELAAKAASDAAAPRVTRIFPISYAKLDDLAGLLTKFGSGSPTAPAAAGGTGAAAVPLSSSTATGLVQKDDRTNSIIVRDLPDNVERMQKLIQFLDYQTPQVLIESKIVEATESFSKNLQGAFGAGTQVSSLIAGGVANGNFGALSGFSVPDVSGAVTQGGGGYGIGLGFLTGATKLNATLNYSEQEGRAKIIASPRIVVLDKEKANIVSSEPTVIQNPVISTGATTISTQILQANLSLSVTPTVTNEGSVIMDLSVSKDEIDTTVHATKPRNMATKVLVESGTTLVIGGIYRDSDSTSEGGVPFLRKIPIIGSLFGNETKNTQRVELFFFITPKILNAKQAGLTS